MLKILGSALSVLIFSVACFAEKDAVKVDPLNSGIDKIYADLANAKIFNAETCPHYINSVTDFMFKQPADYFIPKTLDQTAEFKKNGDSMIKKIFLIRLRLRDKALQFDKQGNLSNECMLKVREGLQYARFTEEYLLEWLVHHKAVTYKKSLILEGPEPFVMRNPEFPDLRIYPGDVFLIRGKSTVSAMIARIGDEEGNFSHVAMVGQNEKGELFVVESLIQYGVVITPLEEWRKAQDARVALYRFHDPEVAAKAAKMLYAWGQGHARYDFAMNDDDYSEVFCSEVVRFAFDEATVGAVKLPKYRSHVSKFKGGAYPKSLGVMGSSLFAPYDLEVEPHFSFVAEGRYYPLLRQVRMQDSVLQSVYEWMIGKGYVFYDSAWVTTQAYLGKGIRYLGFMSEDFPTYMPIKTMKSVLQFETVADALEAHLKKKEDEYYKAKGYLPSFMDMMVWNDEFRKQDCQLFKEGNKSAFHSIYRNETCD
ncbi:YiiX/YebB-like N1pC/P60 family cysteine hydrolase [Bdellovibrio sp. HCB2-146]|uniref:YiiX/YebB-like N1pC/P60 family cysteine hydrolase n=1 Tax=Bdellovibrio sp. HCB2-146 TaxID=3394362 RepID=UPI0039BD3D67